MTLPSFIIGKTCFYFNLDDSPKIFLGINIILVSHLSLTKKTGKVCWQSNDKATSKTPLTRPLLFKTRNSGSAILSFHVQFHFFLSIISSNKELVLSLNTTYPNNEDLSLKWLERGSREKDGSYRLFCYKSHHSHVEG